MPVRHVTPILNVSNIEASVDWFGKLGWRVGFLWPQHGQDVATFGSVCSGAHEGGAEIFLCLDGQGGRGRSSLPATFGPDGDDAADKGSWMSIWVEDVDAVYRECVANGVEVTWPPSDMPWNVREMHVRHPDGHVFRISRGFEEMPI